MAIPSDPHRSQIIAEFGSATKTQHISNGSLADAYQKIFSSTNFSRDAFGGYGKPTLTIGPTTNIGTDSATIQGNVTPNTLDSTYRFEWGVSDFSNTTSWKTVLGTEGSTLVSESITGLSDDTQHQYRLVAYNDFNDYNSSDYIVSSTETFTTDKEYLPPQNLTIQQATFNVPITVDGSWTNDNTTEPISVEWYQNGSLYSTNSKSAGSTSDSETEFFDGDKVKFRAKYTSGNNTNWSSFSSEITLTI